MSARLKLDDPLFVRGDENSVTFLEDSGKVFLNIKLLVNTYEIVDEPSNVSLKKMIENSSRDVKFNENLLGKDGRKNGEIQLKKKKRKSNKARSILNVALEIDPKVPHTGG